MAKNNIKTYSDYLTFYKEAVMALKQEHPDYLRLDGRRRGGNQKPFAYFIYQDQIWKVDADTAIDKLDIADKAFKENSVAFNIRPTRENKNLCLTISGEPTYKKKFYVYLYREI